MPGSVWFDERQPVNVQAMRHSWLNDAQRMDLPEEVPGLVEAEIFREDDLYDHRFVVARWLNIGSWHHQTTRAVWPASDYLVLALEEGHIATKDQRHVLVAVYERGDPLPETDDLIDWWSP